MIQNFLCNYQILSKKYTRINIQKRIKGTGRKGKYLVKNQINQITKLPLIIMHY